MRFVCRAMAVVVAVSAFSAFARGPATEEEKARVVRLATESDVDPLKVYAAEGRWFSKWIDEVPDVMFGPEAPALWMEANVKGDLKRVAIFKYSVSGVSYMVQHTINDPRAPTETMVAVHTAALEGVVRAYGVLRDAKPENKSEAFDAALEKLKKGEFPAFVKSLFEGKK
jgi:hypothetical protein